LKVAVGVSPGFIGRVGAMQDSAFRELISAWWLWAGIIVILGLLGLLYYLRNKTDD